MENIQNESKYQIFQLLPTSASPAKKMDNVPSSSTTVFVVRVIARAKTITTDTRTNVSARHLLGKCAQV